MRSGSSRGTDAPFCSARSDRPGRGEAAARVAIITGPGLGPEPAPIPDRLLIENIGFAASTARRADDPAAAFAQAVAANPVCGSGARAGAEPLASSHLSAMRQR
ncbi:hypothetical protein ACIPPQ_18920 [Sphingopyxis sp. LARHCG72]